MALIAALVLPSPLARAAGSIWVHDGDDLARIDFSSPTTASFTYIGKLGTGATGPNATIWSDTFGASQNVMIDIAWNASGTTLFGLSAAQSGTNNADSYLWAINPITGAAALVTPNGNGIPGDDSLPAGTLGRDSFTITNALGLAADGRMLTGTQTDRILYVLDVTTNTATPLGAFGTSPVARISAGDIETFNGITYLLASTSPYVGGEGEINYLVALDPDELLASIVVGPLPLSFDAGWGLAATSDGLYALDGNSRTISLLNTANGMLTPVTLTGNVAALDTFSGATSTIPEPATLTLLASALLLPLRRSHHKRATNEHK
jgi:hypothetical protein